MKWIKKVATTPLDLMAKVIDSISPQVNDTTNAPSINAVNNALNDIWEKIYPVGSLYMTVNNIDPSSVFGGTWERVQDTFIMAAGNNYSAGTTGGAATSNYTPSGSLDIHKMTVEELPSHDHQIVPENCIAKVEVGEDYLILTTDNTVSTGSVSAGSGISTISLSGGVGTNITELEVNGHTQYTGYNQTHIEGHNHTFTGTQGTINTLPPYLAVYVWKRTA